MPLGRRDERKAHSEILERDSLIAAMRSVLEDSHCIFYMRFENHDAQARQRTAERLVDGIITPALSRARGQ